MIRTHNMMTYVHANQYQPNACKDSNGRIINPGDQVWAEGRRHFVDTVNRVTNEVSCGMNQFDCKDVEVMPR